jgi:hypothetical protein
VAVGGQPTQIAVNEHTHNVYTTDNANGPVSFFRFQKPAAPTNLTVRTQGTTIHLSWRRPADGGLPITYRVIATPACHVCRGLSTPPTSQVPALTITGLARGQHYRFRVQAIDAAGRGPVSAPSQPTGG